MAELNQSPGTLDITISQGDYVSFEITFDFDLTGYTITAAIDDSSGTLVNFTITPGTYSDTSSIITLSLSSAQTEDIPLKQSKWYLKLTSGDNSRTYVSGKFLVI